MSFGKKSSIGLLAAMACMGGLGFTGSGYSVFTSGSRSKILDTPEDPKHAAARIAKAQAKRERRQSKRK